MQQRASVVSPRLEARIAGVLYLLVILLGGFAEVGVRQALVIAGDPAATAQAIMAHARLFHLGFAAEMATNVIAVPLTLIFFRLLAPAGRFWVLLAVVLDLTQNTINAVNAWTQFAPLTLLGGSPDLAAIPHAQLAALARLALTWHDVGFDSGLTFFGFALVIYGVVMVRSEFFPRVLGGLYGLAGACYLANSFAYFFAPQLLSAYLLLPCLVGEGALALWLTLVGINEPSGGRPSPPRRPRGDGLGARSCPESLWITFKHRTCGGGILKIGRVLRHVAVCGQNLLSFTISKTGRAAA